MAWFCLAWSSEPLTAAFVPIATSQSTYWACSFALRVLRRFGSLCIAPAGVSILIDSQSAERTFKILDSLGIIFTIHFNTF